VVGFYVGSGRGSALQCVGVALISIFSVLTPYLLIFRCRHHASFV